MPLPRQSVCPAFIPAANPRIVVCLRCGRTKAAH